MFAYETEKGREPESCQINQIRYGESLKLAACGCEDSSIRLFSPNFPKLVRKIALDSAVNAVELLAESQVACGTVSGTLSIWDLRNYQCLNTFENLHSAKYD